LVTERRFTDRQMAALIRRAAEMQAADAEPGHSLAEIQEIAAELDIDRALLAELAARLPPETPTSWPPLLGPRPTVEVATVLPSSAPPNVANVLEAIRVATGTMGDAHQVGLGLEWHQLHDYSKLHVSVIPGSHGTAVRVAGEYKWRLVLLVGVALPAGTFLGAVLASAVFGNPSAMQLGSLAVAGAGAAALTARAIWTRMMGRATNQLSDLLARIRAVLNAPPGDSTRVPNDGAA
jgi:hypothetical protein